jgi:flavin-dependent dehydrogenase
MVDAAPARPELPAAVDVVVCGGGPGGSTAATVLARAGRSVACFERERFPRFHIGESLLPFNVPLLQRIGALEKLQAQRPTVKPGARFYHQGTDRIRFVRFADGFQCPPTAFQVKRADFDTLLLRHAAASGARVFEGATVEGVDFEGTRAVGVRVRLDGEAAPRTVRTHAVVDATGRDALLAKHLGGRVRDPLLDRSAAFAHWSRWRPDPGLPAGDIIIVTTPEGWWWMIPFGDGSISVGIVMPSARFKARGDSVEALYNGLLAATPEVRERLVGGEPTTPVQAIGDYSYKTARISGDGFVLVGDAACFLDPVFSTGVLLAMTSGEMAAQRIHRSLATRGRVDAADFARYERVYRGGVRRYIDFVHGFYDPAFLETFYSRAPFRGLERAVTAVLAGAVFHPGWRTRFWAWAFRGFVRLVRWRQARHGAGPFATGTGLVQPDPAELAAAAQRW